MMNIKEVSDKLGMNTKTVRKLIRAGKIKAEKNKEGRWEVKEVPSKEELTAKSEKKAKAKKAEVKEEKKNTSNEAQAKPATEKEASTSKK